MKRIGSNGYNSIVGLINLLIERQGRTCRSRHATCSLLSYTAVAVPRAVRYPRALAREALPPTLAFAARDTSTLSSASTHGGAAGSLPWSEQVSHGAVLGFVVTSRKNVPQ